MSTLAKKNQPTEAEFNPILAHLTARNTLVIPKVVTDEFGGIDTFEVTVQEGKIVLTPLATTPAEEVRQKLAAKGITEEDVAEAVKWARNHG